MMNKKFFSIFTSIIILCSLIAYLMAVIQGPDRNYMFYINVIYFMGFLSFLLHSIKGFQDKRIFMAILFLAISLAFLLLFYLNLVGI